MALQAVYIGGAPKITILRSKTQLMLSFMILCSIIIPGGAIQQKDQIPLETMNQYENQQFRVSTQMLNYLTIQQIKESFNFLQQVYLYYYNNLLNHISSTHELYFIGSISIVILVAVIWGINKYFQSQMEYYDEIKQQQYLLQHSGASAADRRNPYYDPNFDEKDFLLFQGNNATDYNISDLIQNLPKNAFRQTEGFKGENSKECQTVPSKKEKFIYQKEEEAEEEEEVTTIKGVRQTAPGNLNEHQKLFCETKKIIKINRSFDSEKTEGSQTGNDFLNEIDENSQSNHSSQLMTSMSFSGVMDQEMEKKLAEGWDTD